MTKFTGRNGMRMVAVLLCSVALALPALAQNGTASSGPPDQAQGPPPGGGQGRRGGDRMEMMTRELNLTPDQVAKIRPIMEDSRKQMQALRDSDASQDDRRAKMMAIQQSQATQIKAFLTDDQKPKYDAMEARMRDRMRGGGGDGGPPPPPPPPPPSGSPQQ